LLVLLTLFLVSTVQLYYVKGQMKTVLAEQQQASVAQVADGIDQKLVVHRDFVQAGTRTIPPEIIEDVGKLQTWADQRHGLRAIFSDIFVISAKGVVLAETPLRGRQGLDVSDREYFRTTVETRKPYISKPFISKSIKEPIVAFSAPVLDKNGAVVLVLSGTLNLLQPNFLGNLAEAKVGKSGSFAVLTRDRTIVISRDKSRILTQGPAPGVSPYFDRATSGLEGSEEGVNSRGLRAIFSYSQLKVVPWVLVAALPVEEAYAPITLAQWRIAVVTLVLGLVLAPVIWLGTRRLLQPLLALRDTIHRIRINPGTAEEVAVERLDEIGDLAKDFNALMRERRQAETALRASEAAFARLAHNDALTGLPNRALFNDRLAQVLLRAQRSHELTALMYLDIDRFKSINDTFGHAAGDELLKVFAGRLVHSVRAADTVARLGGDEFVILLEDLHGPDDGRMIAEKIIDAMQVAFRIGDEPLRVTTSIGIAFADGGETAAGELMKRADSALYEAKRAGRNTFCVAARAATQQSERGPAGVN
jgi:diguanylate cyclase (GGDEF)-like protein